jgi:hypothetical protein
MTDQEKTYAAAIMAAGAVIAAGPTKAEEWKATQPEKSEGYDFAHIAVLYFRQILSELEKA